jgi:hypothetical protein
VDTIVGKIDHQMKCNATAVEKVNQANVEAGHLKTQFVVLYKSQKAQDMKVTQICGQLYQLTLILNQMQHAFQQHKLMAHNLNEPGTTASEPVMVNGVPVEDASRCS